MPRASWNFTTWCRTYSAAGRRVAIVARCLVRSRSIQACNHHGGQSREDKGGTYATTFVSTLDPPDCFDITRRATGHLAFGVGIHGCVGMAVARLEAEIVLSLLARKVEAIDLGGEPERRLNQYAPGPRPPADQGQAGLTMRKCP